MKTIEINEGRKLSWEGAQVIERLKGDPELWLKRYMSAEKYIAPGLAALITVLGVFVIIAQVSKL
jgi:hypothetical protein